MKRHFEDKHMERQDHICTICNNVYKTKNSLRNHTSVYHRRVDVAKTFSQGRALESAFSVPLHLYETFGALEAASSSSSAASSNVQTDAENSSLFPEEAADSGARNYDKTSDQSVSSIGDQGGFEALLVTETDINQPVINSSLI